MTILSAYERKILEVFAASFPLSAHYREGRKLRKSGWDIIFPEISTAAGSKEEFLSAVDSLIRLGLVSAAWKRFRKGDELVALYLENAAKLYELLDEPHPDAVRLEMLAFLKACTARTGWEQELRDYSISHLENRLTLPVTDFGQLKDILRLAAVTAEEAAAFSLRGLSVHLFNQSKRIEEILEQADLLSERVRGEKLSAALRLLRSYPESTLAGEAVIRFKDGRLWDLKGRIITLPYATIRQITSIEWPGSAPSVLSIENKETFYMATHVLAQRFSGFLYTSGQVNTADQCLLKLLKTSGAVVSHFGDLDPGGLLIFSKISKVLDGKLELFLMDVATYNRYLPHGYPLTPGALKKLEIVNIPSLEPLKKIMQDNRKGIEQEIIAF
jgi:hypothetical protein